MSKRLKAAIDDFRTSRAQYQEARQRLPELKRAVDAGVSQTELARALAISRQAVSKMLVDARREP